MDTLKNEFQLYVSEIISLDELQFFCEDCLAKMGVEKPELMYEDTGCCNLCNCTKDVSNAHFNKWFRDRGLTLDPAEKGSGAELRNLIPFTLFKKF